MEYNVQEDVYMDYKSIYDQWCSDAYFDENTNIGRICKSNQSFFELKNNILMFPGITSQIKLSCAVFLCNVLYDTFT